MDTLNAYNSNDSSSDEENDKRSTSEPTSDEENDKRSTSEPTTASRTITAAQPIADASVDNEVTRSVVPRVDRPYVNAAPSVSLATKSQTQQQQEHQRSSGVMIPLKRKHGEQRMMITLDTNPKSNVLYQPVQGPLNDASADTRRQLSRYQPKEIQSNAVIDEIDFHQQRLDFQRSGRALPIVVDSTTTQPELLRTTLGYDRQRLEKFAKQDEVRKKMKLAMNDKSESEALVLGSDDEAEFGVWGPPSRQETFQKQNALTSAEVGDLAPEQLAEREYIAERNRLRGQEEEEKPVMTLDRVLERKMAHLLPPPQKDQKPIEPSTTFHGPAEYDYQGRSWIAPPPGVASAASSHDPDNFKCFVPKKCVARFGGGGPCHVQGVHRIRLFPGTGHLLLSAGLDGTCKVWSVEHQTLMRTYAGHSAAVRDAQFNSTGTQFVSASFDRFLRLWNTESGEVVQSFGNGKVPYCVQFYPRDNSFFVVGCSDNRIVTYHTQTAELTQEYNHHLAPVNAILFVTALDSEPIKMVSSGDDKKILIWEWDIGVPIKYISDPTMHSMPCLTLHPSGQYFTGQSLDNTICCLQTSPKIKLLHNKKFSGHVVSGYACEMTFSPDGRFLVSGDGTGALFIWDWKRHKVLQKYRAHEPGKPTISVVWHPLEPSTLFTASWDGGIKVWR